jgi:ABC-type antimicrobial peptide transport system permease subunit
MLRNHLVVGLRMLLRNPIYTFINIGGLAIGIAMSLLIFIWVFDEVSYDRFLPNLDRIHKVFVNAHEGSLAETWSGIPAFVADQLKERTKEIKDVTLVSEKTDELLSAGEMGILRGGYFVSPSFTEIFQFELVKGSRGKMLDDPSSIIITESTAQALFGNDDPLNKVVSLNNEHQLKVSAVLKDLPENSSFQFDFLMSMQLFVELTPSMKECVGDPDCGWLAMYVELQPGVSAAHVNARVKDLVRNQTTWLEKDLILYPWERWHLHGEFLNGKESDDDQARLVSAFVAVAIGILVIACINFMNLSTARSERRAREIGIRKLAGSRRKDLIIQFVRESILITLFAFMIALVIVELSLPLYNDLLHSHLSINYLSPAFWGASAVLVLVTGVLAGSYPAFFLSSFQPAKVLKGTLLVDARSVVPRKALVILQFGFSIVLLVSTVAIYQQIDFVKGRELGYNPQNLIVVPNNKGIANKYKLIKDDLLKTGAVVSSCKTNSPITGIYEANFLSWPGNTGPEISITNIYAEYDYAKTMGIPLEGRDFIEGYASDTAAVLLNRAAIQVLGYKKPVGSTAIVAGRPVTIIGVLDDVLMDSPYRRIEPLYVTLEKDWVIQNTAQNISIRLASGADLPGALKKVEEVFKKHNPHHPFEYYFVDKAFEAKFHKINLIGTLNNIFATVAIIIAGLGLFGLAAFTAERRTKEFGVRKVLGARQIDLVTLVSRDFVKLIVTAFFLSAPFAWWRVTNFLEGYPYHVSFNWWILPVAGLIVLLTCLAIVSAQAMKVAAANPVDTLRTE